MNYRKRKEKIGFKKEKSEGRERKRGKEEWRIIVDNTLSLQTGKGDGS